jgi:hypothetical protein
MPRLFLQAQDWLRHVLLLRFLPPQERGTPMSPKTDPAAPRPHETAESVPTGSGRVDAIRQHFARSRLAEPAWNDVWEPTQPQAAEPLPSPETRAAAVKATR